MKSCLSGYYGICPQSHPSRGAWIEIGAAVVLVAIIEASHPSRGAWIEIDPNFVYAIGETVAPLAGCVD